MARIWTVLVVENDPDHRIILEVALGLAATITTRIAGTGQEALDLVDRHPVDIVLLDPWLPDIDGMDLMATLSAREPSPPVVVVTANARAAALQTYRDAGALGVITKPFNPITLARDVLALVAA